MAKIASKLILACLLLFLLATAEIAAAQRQKYCPKKAKKDVSCPKCNSYCKKEEDKHHGKCLNRGGERECYCYKKCKGGDGSEEVEA